MQAAPRELDEPAVQAVPGVAVLPPAEDGLPEPAVPQGWDELPERDVPQEPDGLLEPDGPRVVDGLVLGVPPERAALQAADVLRAQAVPQERDGLPEQDVPQAGWGERLRVKDALPRWLQGALLRLPQAELAERQAGRLPAADVAVPGWERHG